MKGKDNSLLRSILSRILPETLPDVPASKIIQNVNNRFVSDAEKSLWNESGGLILGETQTTAYRGDRGKIAYDHSQIIHAPSNAEQNVNADWTASSGDAQIVNKPIIPSALSELSDDSTHRIVTDTEKTTWTDKQNILVSGTNIKTINGNSLLGSGDIAISGGGSDPWTIIKLIQDFVSSVTANTNVTNFRFTPLPNKTYLIFGYFLLRTATATVGARPGIAWPTNLVDATIRMEAATSLTASVIRTWGAQTTQNAASTGLATNTHSHWGSLDGIMITAANVSGNFQITIASETAGTNVTMKAGSILMYREL